MDVVPGYEPLAEVFQTALNQSQKGKGKERHANDKPFLQQPIAEIGRMVGVGYNVGQAMKKGQESMRIPDDRAQAELLGAMVYLASAYLLIGERMEAEKRAAVSDIPIGANNISVCANCTSHCDQFSLFRTICAASVQDMSRRALTPAVWKHAQEDAVEAARGALANDAAHRDGPQVEVNVGETWIIQKANATALTTVVIDDISEHTVVMTPQGAQYLGKELQRKKDIQFVERVVDAAHKATSLCDSEVGKPCDSCAREGCNGVWLEPTGRCNMTVFHEP